MWKLLCYTGRNTHRAVEKIMEEEKGYSVNVKVNDKYLENVDDNVFISMKLLYKEGKVDGLSFGSNHDFVNQELFTALDQFQTWLKLKLPPTEIISKLQELDSLQYGHELACDRIGQAIAELYYTFLMDKNK